MTRCLAIDDSTGAVVATSDTACTGSQYVIVTQAELDLMTASPFRLSVADGAILSSLIVSVWVTGAIARWLVDVIRDRGQEA
jgi:hypothetical protein